jgi:hypothetical protein
LPSASSSRITVARVKARRPDSAFSRVEMLIRAMSASAWREMRRGQLLADLVGDLLGPRFVEPLVVKHQTPPAGPVVRTKPHISAALRNGQPRSAGAAVRGRK